MIEGSGSVPRLTDPDPGGPKNILIRIHNTVFLWLFFYAMPNAICFSTDKCSTRCTSTTLCPVRSVATASSTMLTSRPRGKRWPPRNNPRTGLRWRGSAAILASICRRRSSGIWCTLRTGLETCCWSSSTKKFPNQVRIRTFVLLLLLYMYRYFPKTGKIKILTRFLVVRLCESSATKYHFKLLIWSFYQEGYRWFGLFTKKDSGVNRDILPWIVHK